METRNIAELLYRIKESIKRIEDGDTRTSLLMEVETGFLAFLELIKLFLISERDSYYGYFLMNMQFRANFHARLIAGIKLNEFPPVLESNPLLLCKYTLKEILFIVCHEIDHVVLNHPAEMVKANPEEDPQKFYEFNLAADASVNDRILHEITEEQHTYLKIPDGAITSDSLKKMCKLRKIKHLENYAYYLQLIQERAPQQNAGAGDGNGQSSMMSAQNEKDGLSDSTDGVPGKSSEADKADEGEENEIITAVNCGKVQDHEWEAGSDAEYAGASVRELINAAYQMMSEESRGLMPGFFLSQVKKVNQPPVLSWQAVLKKYVGTISADKRKTRLRLNRRQPERFDLSGRMDEKILKIVVAIDTSASVSDSMITRIFTEIFAILAKRKHEITVVECDAAVRRVYKVRRPQDVQQKITGRGGTAFKPVIEYLNNDRYFRDALLIYFTDGYGEKVIPKPKTYRNIWVVIGDARHLSLEEPYGAVLTI